MRGKLHNLKNEKETTRKYSENVWKCNQCNLFFVMDYFMEMYNFTVIHFTFCWSKRNLYIST